METLKFLQLADLAGYGSWEPWVPCLSAHKQEQIAGAGVEALRRAVQIAHAERTDVLLCHGGLFDDRTITADQARELYSILGTLDPMPVLIVPGEADPLHPYSYHDVRFFEAQTGASRPRNVSILNETDAQWQQRLLAPLEGAVLEQESRPGSPRRARYEGLLGTIQDGKLQSESLQAVSLDTSCVVLITVTVTPDMKDVAQLQGALAEAAREAGATRSDLVVATLQGTASQELLGQSWRPLYGNDAGAWFALVVDDSQLMPARPERGRKPDPEERLVQCVLRRLIHADAASGSELLTAVRMTLQTLSSGSVDLPDVD